MRRTAGSRAQDSRINGSSGAPSFHGGPGAPKVLSNRRFQTKAQEISGKGGNEGSPWGNEGSPWGNEGSPWGNEGSPWAPREVRSGAKSDIGTLGQFARNKTMKRKGKGKRGKERKGEWHGASAANERIRQAFNRHEWATDRHATGTRVRRPGTCLRYVGRHLPRATPLTLR